MTNWVAPGAGAWRRDDSHLNTVLTGFMDKLLHHSMAEGFAAGFAFYGAMLAGFEQQWVAGRVYSRPKIAGAPAQPIWGDKPPAKLPKAGGPPPKLIFKILMKLHPELRKRSKRAAEVYRTKAWREMAGRWTSELRPAFWAENRKLTRVDVATLDDAALAAHLAATTEALRAMIVQHFTHAPMQTVTVGELVHRVGEWTGAKPSEALELLRGSSPASLAGADAEAAVAKAVAGDARAKQILESDQPAAEIVAAFKQMQGAVGDAMRELLEVYGLRPVTGLDLNHQMFAELPEVIVRGVRCALAKPHVAPAAPSASTLRDRVPEAHRAEFDETLAEARLTYGVRDDDVGVLLWRAGLVRRAILEAARRLVARGALLENEHGFDAQSDELQALLRGGSSPSAKELAARTAKRHDLAELDPPVFLGEGSGPPPADYFPPAVARMMLSVQAFLSSMEGARDHTRGDNVRGTGVSKGVYEGRARLVRHMSDFAKIEEGDVLVAPFTSPAYNVLLPLIGAIVTERGGVLSHAAIVAREYNVPGVVDTRNALAKIPDGSLVRVDGAAGTVEVIAAVAPAKSSNKPVAAVADEPPPRVVPTTPGRVVPLRDAGAGEFGGKAKALAGAFAAKLPVPDGVALDADLVQHLVDGDADARARVTAAIKSLGAPWAVRSSAIGEDSAQASFAGQHATVLGVTADELFDAITKVHASGYTASARAYRAKMNLPATSKMGVVIQTLLRPDISGVLFSHDPTATREGKLIEATWGLGEALVSGLVTPDRYRLAADGKVIERAIGDKDIAIEACADGGTAEIAIGKDRAKTACLDDARLAELAQLASRCEQLFGGPQDLEWAVANGRLHLLQSRPVTTRVR